MTPRRFKLFELIWPGRGKRTGPRPPRKRGPSRPVFYLGLCTSEQEFFGDSFAESEYSGYARIPLTEDDVCVSGGRITNTTELRFPQCVGSGDTVTHYALFNSMTGGNMVAVGEMACAQAMSAGISPVFEVGMVSFRAEAPTLADLEQFPQVDYLKL